MSSFDSVTEPVYSEESGMQVLAAELKLEISSHLGIQDQLAMRKVCKSWRSYLDMYQVFLSRYVDIDVSKLLEPPGNQQANRDDQRSRKQNRHSWQVSRNVLEHALRMYVQKNTEVVVIRHMECKDWTHAYSGVHNESTSQTVGRVLKEKGTHLFHLVFKDCELPEVCGVMNWCWANPQSLFLVMLRGLASVTRKFTLDTFSITNALGGHAPTEDMMLSFDMPCSYSVQDRLAAGNMYKKLPIVLPHHEVECTKPFDQLFRSFIMVVDAQCPPVSPVVRDDIMQLCSFWRNCGASQRQWLILHNFIKCFNEGVPNYNKGITRWDSEHVTVDISDITALRQLDPLSLNRITTEVLHRMYCLPSRGLVYPPPARCPYDEVGMCSSPSETVSKNA